MYHVYLAHPLVITYNHIHMLYLFCSCSFSSYIIFWSKIFLYNCFFKVLEIWISSHYAMYCVTADQVCAPANRNEWNICQSVNKSVIMVNKS